MTRTPTEFFDASSEPLDRRIATGLHKLGLAMKHETWAQASDQGLSPTQGQIISALALEGPLTGTELAARLGVTLPTISDSARVLVEKGFADKRPDPRHARASLLTLTAKGRSAAARVSGWPDFLTAAVDVLTPVEQRAFFAGVVKMIRTLQVEGRIPTSRMCVSCKFFQPNAHDGPAPHHCAFVDAPMAPEHLRIDCAEHGEAAESQRQAAWRRFTTA